jgi:putative SOS response-associated peptidase YedK
MCGRYRLKRYDFETLRLRFVPSFEEFSEIKIVPRFNIAPSQNAPIIRAESGKLVVTTARWGFVPGWTKGKPKFAPINARSDTIAMSGMFRQAFRDHRCLIPADGFYESKGLSTQKVRPWYFFQRPDESLFTFAGLWSRWHPEPGGKPVDTFTIITTAPNRFMSQIHDRQPLILKGDDRTRWIEDKTPPDDLLAPDTDNQLEAWPVSDDAKSPRNEGERLVEPIGPKL